MIRFYRPFRVTPALVLGSVCLLASHTRLGAQLFPRAAAVDPALAPNAAEDFFQRGKNVYDSATEATDLQTRIQLFQRSTQIFSEYLAAFPNHPNAEMAWWYLGISQYKSGYIEDSKRCFSTLLNRYGDGKWAAAAAYTMAADHYNKGEYQFAAPLFERYAKNAAKPEERPRGKYFAGNCYRLLGRDREAIAAYQAVLADPLGAPHHGDVKLALGYLSLNAGKLSDAITRFDEVFKDPGHTEKTRGEAALQAALAASKLGNTAEADRYLRLILGTPGMADFHEDARTALMSNLFAKKEYREVMRLHESGSSTATGDKLAARLMIVARSLMRLEKPSEALVAFREVEKLVKPETDTAFQAAYYRLLCFYEIEGSHMPEQVDAFLQLYQKSRPADARIHTALMMKAETLFSNKKIEEAAKTYAEINAAVVSAKNKPGLLYQRGWCLHEAGDAQGAIRSLSDFISEFPDDPRLHSAYAKRAMAYSQVAEPQKAIVDFDRLTKENVSADLRSFAWLESARMRRADGNIQDMIARYKGLLQHDKSLSENLQAEANYWIGWGMVKSNTGIEAAPHLETARSLRPDAYRKHAGILLALGYYAAQDAANLAKEIRLAIDARYDSDIPDQALQWCGVQTYNSGDYEIAATCLGLVSTPEDPRSTPKEVWRYLGKARLETGDPANALMAINFALEFEDQGAWKADGLLDRARALFALKRYEESRNAADEAMALRPQGRTSGGLRILIGDLESQKSDYKKAAAEYLVVVQFMDDKILKPIALHKLAGCLEKQGNAGEAATYRAQLQKEFPDWKP
jgi:tetratricopeptide (TPR) repeat protein